MYLYIIIQIFKKTLFYIYKISSKNYKLVILTISVILIFIFVRTKKLFSKPNIFADIP